MPPGPKNNQPDPPLNVALQIFFVAFTSSDSRKFVKISKLMYDAYHDGRPKIANFQGPSPLYPVVHFKIPYIVDERLIVISVNRPINRFYRSEKPHIGIGIGSADY